MRFIFRMYGGTLLVLALAAGQLMPEPLATFNGVVRTIDGKTLRLDEAGPNTLEFFCSHKTRYFSGSKRIKASDIKPGDRVAVESKTRLDGALEAINVRLEPPKPAPK